MHDLLAKTRKLSDLSNQTVSDKVGTSYGTYDRSLGARRS